MYYNKGMQPESGWKILLITEDPQACQQARAVLDQPQMEWAAGFEAGSQALDQNSYDAVLVDEQLGEQPGLALIQQASARGNPAALILLAAQTSDALDLQALQAGATLCMDRADLYTRLLARAIYYSIERKHIETALRVSRDELQQRNITLQSALAQAKAGQRLLDARNQALRESEIRYRRLVETLQAILDAAKESIWLFDPRGVILLGNTIALARLHRPAEDVIGRHFSHFMPTRLAHARQKRINQVVETRAPVEFEDQRAGISFRHSFYPVIDLHGQVTGVACFSIDITQQKASQGELESAHRQVVEILESINDAFYSLDQAGRFTYVNQKAMDLWGKPHSELLGKSIWEVFPTGKETDSYHKIQQALVDRQPVQYESYSEFLDQWLDIHLYPTKQGVSVYFQDITPRKRTERALQERNRRLALLSEIAAELLVDRDPRELLHWIYTRLSNLLPIDLYVQYNLAPDGTRLELGALTGFSETARQALERQEPAPGWTAVLNRQPLILNDVQQSGEAAASFLRAEGLTTYACFPLTVTERLIGALAFGSRQCTSFDEEALALLQTISHLIATATDRWQANNDLASYTRQLERQNRNLQEFAYMASHDLQEPLRKIEIFGDNLLEHSAGLDHTQRDYLKRIHKAAGRMRDMVEGMLALSNLDSGAQLEAQVELTTLVQEVLVALQSQISASGAQVSVQPLPAIEAEPQQMRQLFQHLLGNALKYHPPGSLPRVEVFAQPAGPGQVQIVVQDNGIGFPAEAAARIFQPFQRAVGAGQFEGTGIGLAICRKIAENHGGSLTARSQPGEGAAFIVTLPLRQEPVKRPCSD